MLCVTEVFFVFVFKNSSIFLRHLKCSPRNKTSRMHIKSTELSSDIN